jgi:tetratricopeptide (TPR) repeat protein
MNTVTDQAIAQTGDRMDYRLGLLALRDGDAVKAIALLTRAVAAHPGDAGMRRNLIRALLAAERFDDVVQEAARALAASPDDADLHHALGTALNGCGQPARASCSFARAIALRPGHAPSWLNRANAATDLDDLAAAEPMYRTALDLDPGLAEAHASLGYALTRQGRLPEAIEACETAIRLRPDFARAHMNLATALLLIGDLRRGLAEYEWRKRVHPWARDFPRLAGPEWDGGDPDGQTILVRAEQGFGDVIQCARYLRLIREAGGSPILACQPALMPLMSSISAVCPADGPLPRYDAWIDLMSLPRAFGSIPLADGYLAAEADRVETWRARLPPGRKIGIALSGNPLHAADGRRSIPAALFRPPPIDGVHWINLQHGPAARTIGLPDLTPWMTGYAETAALIENLDRVVTVDTSVAHLAGALGKPAFVMLPHAPDWRWMLGRPDSPWYASVRLFRQDTAGDWGGVLDRVMRELTLDGRRH